MRKNQALEIRFSRMKRVVPRKTTFSGRSIPTHKYLNCSITIHGVAVAKGGQGVPGNREIWDAQAAVAVASKFGVAVKVAVDVFMTLLSGVSIGVHVGQTGEGIAAVGQISVTAGRARVANDRSKPPVMNRPYPTNEAMTIPINIPNPTSCALNTSSLR